jgi:hypothetical protein
MITTTKRGRALAAAVLAAAASLFGTGRAEAQWGGMGIGFFGGNLFGNVPQPVTFDNSVALARMNHVRGPIQNNVYGNNPNAYYNHIRDNGFVERYSPEIRDPAYYGYSSRAGAQRPTPTSASAVPVRPLVPLSSFFNDKDQLVWPGDSPISGDLKEKRAATDQACQVAREELKKNGVASIAAVTEARQKLLDYGRPALKQVKAQETPRVADSFHVFLLSLYDSLGQAANPS